MLLFRLVSQLLILTVKYLVFEYVLVYMGVHVFMWVSGVMYSHVHMCMGVYVFI